LLPVVAVAAALFGLKAFHFDIAFHLERNSTPLVASSAVAAVLNVALTVLAIPRFGILGAAYATVVAFSVALILSAWWGRFLPQMPQVWPLAAKSIAFFAVAYVCCFLIGKLPLAAIWLCAVSVAIGAVVCGFSAWCLDVGGIRQVVRTSVVGRLFAR
jgi:O-antigen/teichoic acid export membrane protein